MRSRHRGLALAIGTSAVWCSLVAAACTQIAGVEDGNLADHKNSGGTSAGGGGKGGSGGVTNGGSAGSSSGATGGSGGFAGASGGFAGANGGTSGAGGGNGGSAGSTASGKYAEAVLPDGPLAYW